MSNQGSGTTPWVVPSKWSVSKYAYEPEVRAGWQLPKRVTFHDITLRDGEQTPGVVFRKEEKLKIAHALADAGIQRIEGGMAAVSPEDADALRQMGEEIKTAEICSFSRTRRDDIELIVKCKIDRAVIEIGANDQIIKGIWGSREKAVESVVTSIKFAKENGLKVTFFLMQSARADLDLLETLIVPAVKEGGADAVALVDTQGNCYPQAFGWLVKKVKSWVNVPIEIHCHSMWGVGTATTLAGVTAGAEIVHTCINGLGGNPALDECIMGIEAFLGIPTGIKTEKFKGLSDMVKEYSKTGFYKPFVGEGVNQVEVGIATQMMWGRRQEPGYGAKDVLNYEVVGGKTTEVVLGKKSGRFSLLLKAMELGIPEPPDNVLPEMLAQVKRLSEEKKGLVNDDEFKKIYTQLTGTTV